MERQVASQRPEHQPGRLSNCKFTADDLAELNGLLQSSRFSSKEVSRLRAELAQPFKPPPLTALQALQSIDVPFRRSKPAVPEWVSVVAKNRTHFANALFKFDSPGGPGYWKFVYAKQQPHVVCLVALREVEGTQGLARELAAVDLMMTDWDHVYEEDWACFAWSDDGAWKPEWGLSVLFGSAYIRGRRLAADGRWLPWSEVLHMWPEIKLPRGETAEAKAVGEEQVTFDADVYSRNPWLADFLKWGPLRESRASTKASPAASSARPPEGRPQEADPQVGEEADPQVGEDAEAEAGLRQKIR